MRSPQLFSVSFALFALVSAACGGTPAPSDETGASAAPTTVRVGEPEVTPTPTTNAVADGDDDGDDSVQEQVDDETDNAEPAPAAQPPDPTPRLRELLRWAPASALESSALDSAGLIEFSGLDQAASAEGVAASDCTADDDAEAERLRGLLDLNQVVTVPPSWFEVFIHDPSDLGRTLGVRVCEVGAWARWPSGNTTTLAMATAVERDEVAHRLADDEVWIDLLSTVTLGAHEYWTWGDGLDISFTRGSPARGVGQAGTIGFVDDSVVLRALDGASHEAAIAAGTTGPNVLELPGMGRAVEIFEASGAYRVTISPPPNADLALARVPVGDVDEARAQVRGLVLLEQYEWVAWGVSRVGDTDIITLTIAHQSPEAAQANAERFVDILESVPINLPGDRTWAARLGWTDRVVVGNLAVFEFEPERVSSAVTTLGFEAYSATGTLFRTN